MNEVYYRIYYSNRKEIVVVTMQRFDEDDYDQLRFLSDKKFGSIDEAEALIREMKESSRAFPSEIREALNKFDKPNYTGLFD